MVLSASTLGCGLAEGVGVATVGVVETAIGVVDGRSNVVEVNVGTDEENGVGIAKGEVGSGCTELDGPPSCAHLTGHVTSV